MDKKTLLRYFAILLCTLTLVGVLLGVGYVVGSFLRPYTPPPGATTETTTEATTEETTELTTEETAQETEETTEQTLPVVQMPPLSLLAKHGFVYILKTGQFIMLKGGADSRIYPASLTKLFSAYVALGILRTDTKVAVGAELALVPDGSSIAGLRQGDELTVQTLVEAMLLSSGNDAAQVLAVAAGRALTKNPALEGKAAVARFVQEMNTQAKKFGLSGTHFANPDGYHRSDHYTTCRDMVKIGELVLANTVMRRAMGAPEKFVDIQNPYVESWKNTNLLLHSNSEFYNPYALGMKTGYTGAAGYCLMSAFDVNGTEFMIGVFGCEETDDRFADTQKIFAAFMQQWEG